MKHLFIFLTLLTCTYSNFIINPYVIAPAGSGDLPTANLVAHYQPSGISRHGLDTVNGTAQIDTGEKKFGTGALNSPSGTDHIQEGVSSDWDHGTNDWTYETWVKNNNLAEANRPVFANMTGGTMNATNIAVAVRVSNQTIFAEVSDGATLTTMTNSSTGWNNNVYRHFAFVRQGNTIRFYLDGVELSNTAFSASLNSGKKMTWGSNEDGTSGVTQRFDEMRISNICRYPDGTTFALATEAFTADANTIYLNHCDGTNASTRIYDSALSTSACALWVDDSGNELDVIQNTGSLQPVGTASSLDGHTGLTFDGSNDSLSASTVADWKFLHDGTDYTIFIIANSNQNGTTQVYLSTNNAGSADEGFTFYHDDTNNNGVVFVSKGSVGNPNFNLIMNNDSIPNDAYHSIMIKHENGAGGNDLTTEVDATAEGSQEPSNLPFSSSNPLSALCVGCLPNGTSDFDGVIVEIAIYNVALSTALIDQFNAYKNAKYPSLP